MQCAYNIPITVPDTVLSVFAALGATHLRSDIKHSKVQPNVVLFNAAISAAEKVLARARAAVAEL